MEIKRLRRAARLTQLELSELSTVSRMRLSMAECAYLTLKEFEEAAVRGAMAKALERREQEVRDVLLESSERL